MIAKSNLSAELDNILSSIAQGEASALERFSVLYGRWLFHKAYRFLQTEHLAEEALQETLIKVWQKAPLWKPEKGNAQVWTSVILSRVCIDMQRKSKRFLPLEYFLEEKDETTLNQINTSIRWAEVRPFLKKLSAKQRGMLFLVYAEGHTYAEVSEIYQTSVKNVEVTLYRGLKKLKEDCLKDDT